jgi:ABC-type glycerol-3-phosphate transport system permease component
LFVPLSTIAASMILGFLAPLVFPTDDARYPISLKLISLVGNIAAGTPRWNLFAAGSLLNLVLVASLTALLRRPLSSTALSQYEG